MESVSEIIGPIVELILVPVKKHLGYLFSSTKHVRNMSTKMKQLDARRVDVKKHMEANNISSREIPARVPGWLEEVEKIKEDSEDIPRNGIGCFDLKKRYRAGKGASMIIEKIGGLIKEKLIWNDKQKPLGKVMSSKKEHTSAPLNDNGQGNDFKSREKIFNDALGFLQQDHKTQVIALCGMGGVGKTTMMEQLKNTVEDKKMYDWIVKVVIGQQVNIFSIQEAVSEYIGQPLTEKSKNARADRLRMILEKMSQEAKNKILIILDDVWEMIELKDIGLPSPLPNSFKLLLTSRNESICRQIAVEANSDVEVVRVDVMEESEANNFFCQITGVSDNPELHDIGIEIVKRCGFLPLAIKIIATTLRTQEKPIWRNSLSRLKKNDLDRNLQEIIDISYTFLKEEEERAIFLLCGLFPEDFNIPTEDLTRYVWGLNLLKDITTFRDARDRTETCVRNLKNTSLLIDSDLLGCVKMHDLVLAFVLGKVSKGDQPWVIKHGDVSSWSEAERSETCKRISLTCLGMSEFPRDFKYPNLSLLRLMRGGKSLKFHEDFYEKMGNLEVIAYEKMEYPLLPRSLQCSTKLRTLCFHRCLLMFDCSPIGNILSLEVLTFSYCGIRKLPSAIGNLKKLQLLNVAGCIDLRIDDGVFKNLVNLEELYMRAENERSVKLTVANFKELADCSKNLSALEIEFFEENACQLKNMSFSKLERFKISIGRFLYDRIEKGMHSFENTLSLVTKKDELLESGVNELFEKTEVLSLQVEGMNDIEQVMVESMRPPPQHSFYNLKDLTLNKCAELRHVFTVPMANGLVKLERLAISECPVMEEVVYNEINGGVGVIKFQKLKYLKLNGLPKLVGICNSTSNAIELPELVQLTLYGLPNFTSIYPENRSSTSSSTSCSDISASRPFLNKEVVIPKLEILRIKSMEKLKSIWATSCEIKSSSSNEEKVIRSAGGGCSLREIRVYRCGILVNLFPSNPMALLHRLEILYVSSCSSIEVLFNIDVAGCVNNVGEIEEEGKGSRSGSLRHINVHYSREFREVWRLKGGVISDHMNYNISNWFQAVEEIKISRCERFRNLFTPPTVASWFHLPALRSLALGDVSNNGELVQRMRQQQQINITNVAFPLHLIQTFHHLQKLKMRSLIDAEVVFEIESATSNQPPLLPHLKSLSLSNMEKMNYVWKCNWNCNTLFTKKEGEYSSFQDLASIHVRRCKNIKYLFSPFMIKLLSGLEKIKISDCEGIEEVFSNRDEKLAASTSIHDHDKVDVTSVFPFHELGKLQKLKELRISECRSMRVIFEIEGVNNNGGQSTSSALTIQRSTNMIFLEFPNLMVLKIKKCDLLEHLFTSSTLESLKQLVELRVEECKSLQVIVKEDGEHKTSRTVALPRLKSLALGGLPNIKGFFLGMNAFQWPLLDKVEIDGCPEMVVFTSGHSTTPKLKYIHTGLGKHSLECGLNFPFSNASSHETQFHSSSALSSTDPDMIRLLQSPFWSFSNLIEVDANQESKLLIRSRVIFPCHELLKLQNLEKLHITDKFYLSSWVVEEIFEVVEQRNDDDDDDDDVNEKQSVVVVLPKLKEINLFFIQSLKHIWQSNQRVVMNFPNLTKVSITLCPLLEHIFTSCMVGSLLQLQELQISSCKNMEVIIKQDGNDSSDTTTNDEVVVVVFPRLKSIKLDSLNNLKGFYLGKEDFLFPSLDNLEIKECPQITVFTSGKSTTPELKVIETSFGLCYATEDPTSFIMARQEEGLQF